MICVMRARVMWPRPATSVSSLTWPASTSSWMRWASARLRPQSSPRPHAWSLPHNLDEQRTPPLPRRHGRQDVFPPNHLPERLAERTQQPPAPLQALVRHGPLKHSEGTPQGGGSLKSFWALVWKMASICGGVSRAARQAHLRGGRCSSPMRVGPGPKRRAQGQGYGQERNGVATR